MQQVVVTANLAEMNQQNASDHCKQCLYSSTSDCWTLDKRTKRVIYVDGYGMVETEKYGFSISQKPY